MRAGKPRTRSAPVMVWPKSRAAWRAWLAKHHADSPGVRLVVKKKYSPGPGVLYEEAVEEALCFGWIDSSSNRLDGDSFTLYVSPRKPRSVWSASNKRRIASLTRRGLMEEPGRAAVRVARKNGTWQMLADVDALRIPPDLQNALAVDAGTRRGFDSLSAASRRILIYRVLSARRPETRARRVAEAVAATRSAG